MPFLEALSKASFGRRMLFLRKVKNPEPILLCNALLKDLAKFQQLVRL